MKLLKDLLINISPFKKSNLEGYAFIVHPRDETDLMLRFSSLKKAPNWLLKMLIRNLWPLRVSSIEGLKNKQGEAIRGWIIACPMTAREMLNDRTLAQKKIIQTVKFAKKLGAKWIGLGALIPAITKLGVIVKENVKDIYITTGHSYTVYLAVFNVVEATKYLGIKKKEVTIAIVGAAGAIGNACYEVLKQKGFRNFIFLEREEKINGLKDKNQKIDEDRLVTIDFFSLKKADIILVATSSPDAIVKPEHVSEGTVIIDDSQPVNVSEESIRKMKNVLLIHVLARKSGINTRINFGFPSKEEIFGCLGEVMAIAANGIDKDFTLGNATPSTVKEIGLLTKASNIFPAEFSSFGKKIFPEQFKKIRTISVALQNVKKKE